MGLPAAAQHCAGRSRQRWASHLYILCSCVYPCLLSAVCCLYHARQFCNSSTFACVWSELLLVSGCRVVVYDEEEGVSGERRLLAPAPHVSTPHIACRAEQSRANTTALPALSHLVPCARSSLWFISPHSSRFRYNPSWRSTSVPVRSWRPCVCSGARALASWWALECPPPIEPWPSCTTSMPVACTPTPSRTT